MRSSWPLHVPLLIQSCTYQWFSGLERRNWRGSREDASRRLMEVPGMFRCWQGVLLSAWPKPPFERQVASVSWVSIALGFQSISGEGDYLNQGVSVTLSMVLACVHMGLFYLGMGRLQHVAYIPTMENQDSWSAAMSPTIFRVLEWQCHLTRL